VTAMAGIAPDRLLALWERGRGATPAECAAGLLDALPDNRSAMLYSLSAMTSYGHANLFLKAHCIISQERVRPWRQLYNAE